MHGTAHAGGELMADITPPVPAGVPAGFKFAQLFQLVKDNQLVTALVVFLMWQTGALTTAAAATGCI